MRPEALSAIVGPSMRPSTLEAATCQACEEVPAQSSTTPSHEVAPHGDSPSHEEHSRVVEENAILRKQAPTPFGQQTDGTQCAAKIVEEMVHGVKAAVGGAIAWAEKKVDDLSSQSDSTGPYTCQATCVPSDLDPIASGVLAAMPMQQTDGIGEPVQTQNDNDEREKNDENEGEKKNANDEDEDGEGKDG